MKTLATPLFFLNKPISFGQEVLNKLSPTTEAEYNYLTKGYRVQMESGLDMTKGYTFQDMDHVKYGNYSCQVKVSFVRKNKELAGLLVVTKSDVFGRIDYVGIPLIRIYSHAISIILRVRRSFNYHLLLSCFWLFRFHSSGYVRVRKTAKK